MSRSWRAALIVSVCENLSQMSLDPQMLPRGSHLLGWGVITAKSPGFMFLNWAADACGIAMSLMIHVRFDRAGSVLLHCAVATSLLRNPDCAIVAMTAKIVVQYVS